MPGGDALGNFTWNLCHNQMVTSYSRIMDHIVVLRELKTKSAIGFINAYPEQSIKRRFLKIP